MGLAHQQLPQTPPGHSGAPIIGEIREWLADPLVFARTRHDEFGPIFRTHLLGKPTVVLLEPEGNRFMLSSGMEHFSWREGWGRSMLRLMGGGLSLSDGERHDTRRGILRPAFSHARLQGMVPWFYEEVRSALSSWSLRPSVRIVEAARGVALEIALATICGPLSPAVRQRIHADFDAFTAGLFTPLPWNIPGTLYHRAVRAGKRLRSVLEAVVRERRLAGSLGQNDALSLLLASDAQPELNDIVSELLLLLWAGHDTVASLVTWIIYELGRHPETLERVRAEISAVLGTDPPTAATLRQLPWLEAVIKEGERLHPPAPGGFRGVIKPFNYNKYTVPAGWLAMYSSVYTHMDERIWRQPETFAPERHLAPRNEGKEPFSLIGFGGGPRVCIGVALAQIEMRLLLIELVRGYTWELEPGQSLERVWLPTNQPRDGLIVRLTPAGAKGE